MILRTNPGQRIHFIPGIGINVIAPRSGAAAESWWLAGGISAANCVAAYQAKGAASYAASLVNLAQPGTYNLTTAAAPDWAVATGWSFTARTQYLDTGIDPDSANWSVLCKFSDCPGAGNYYVFGRYLGNTRTHFSFTPNYYAMHYYMYAAGLAVNTTITNGVVGWRGAYAYRDGLSDGTITQNYLDTSVTVCIGNLNHSGKTYSFMGKIQSFSIYNVVITEAQLISVTAAMNAL